MSVGEILDATGGAGETGISHPAEGVGETNVASSPVETLHDAMVASIGRTMLFSSVRIPLLSYDVLQAGNTRVQKEYGEDARKLVIVGPDAVVFEAPPTIRIPDRSMAQLLGLHIAKRQLLTTDRVLELGYLRELVQPLIRKKVVLASYHKLRTLVRDTDNEPMLVTSGNNKSAGIPDAIITDFRHTPRYTRLRQLAAVPYFERFILIDGQPRPSMSEEGFIIAARSAMRKIASHELNRNEAQRERFQIISQQVAAMMEHRTDVLVQEIEDEWGERELQALNTEAETEFEQRWQTRAACRGPQSEVFFPPPHFERKPDRRERESRAKLICASCAVRSECLSEALTLGEGFGVWGGLNEQERKAIKVRLSA